jgi:uncharacterized phage protein gp47/JayE
MSYGLKPEGFVKKTFQVIKNEIDADMIALFGNDIDLDSDQPLGQWVGIRAKREADIWDLMEEIYNSRSPDRATGVSLDFIASENNLTRIPAVPTTITNAVLFGENGTVVLGGRRIKNTRNSFEFLLDSTVNIINTNCVFAQIEFDSFNIGQTYSIIVRGTNFSEDGITDEATTFNLFKTAIESFFTDVFVTIVDDEIQIQSVNIMSIDIGVDLKYVQIGSRGNFTSEETGSIPAPANSITEIITPVTGWDRVTNPTAGITGRNAETDTEFRIRRFQNISGAGAGTEEAIRSALLNDVLGVNGVNIVSNRTAVADVDGRPPHSFEVVISGGDNQQIANTIWLKQPAGILSVGNISENVIDSQGFTQIISFTRPLTKFIWVIVKRSLYNEEIYPADGDTMIKEAIVEWSIDTNNIDVGKDVIIQRLFTPVYTVQGILNLAIEIAVTDDPLDIPVYGSVNIPIGIREIANFDTLRITVQDL